MLAEGHLLIEDPPGTGKTSLAKAMRRRSAVTSAAVQFPRPAAVRHHGRLDLQPCPGDFSFRKESRVHQRAGGRRDQPRSPRTQAALLEVMEERQVTADGETAWCPGRSWSWQRRTCSTSRERTRCPRSSSTSSAMKISLGYASRDAELEVMARQDGRDLSSPSSEPVLDQHSMAALIQRVRTVNVAVPLRSTSPTSSNARGGRVPRHQHPWHAHPAVFARAYALAEGATSSPDDIKALYQAVLQHASPPSRPRPSSTASRKPTCSTRSTTPRCPAPDRRHELTLAPDLQRDGAGSRCRELARARRDRPLRPAHRVRGSGAVARARLHRAA